MGQTIPARWWLDYAEECALVDEWGTYRPRPRAIDPAPASRDIATVGAWAIELLLQQPTPNPIADIATWYRRMFSLFLTKEQIDLAVDRYHQNKVVNMPAQPVRVTITAVEVSCPHCGECYMAPSGSYLYTTGDAKKALDGATRACPYCDRPVKYAMPDVVSVTP